MPRITQELLRSRSEHNEMCLSNLEEITLHQFELEKIELLETYCRHLKILYLQNNIIEKMEGLNKLKELEYLNMALNNISMIEGISGCESLKKLDMTVNFIGLEELEESMVNLSRCPVIKELYLTGNPCNDWSGCRDFVIATVPTLESLDGKEILPTERIHAQQRYDDLLVELCHTVEMRKIQKASEEEKRNLGALVVAGGAQQTVPEAEKKSAYTKESRREMYLEMAADKEKQEKEKNKDKVKEKAPPSKMFKANGEIRVCNEGKLKFTLLEYDDQEWSFFELEVPKFLDTSLLDVNLNPKWLSVRVKGKLIQLTLNEEISVEESETKRSQITGFLQIKMKKVSHTLISQDARLKQQEEKQKAEIKKNAAKKAEEERQAKLLLCDKIEQKLALKKEDHTTFDDVPDLE